LLRRSHKSPGIKAILGRSLIVAQPDLHAFKFGTGGLDACDCLS
jgi:hypothetical protein